MIRLIKKVFRAISGCHWHGLWFHHLAPKWMLDHSLPFGSYNIARSVWHPLDYLGDVCRQAKWFVQRGKRGYADNSIWSLDWYLTGFMGNALRELADQVHGTPIIDVGRVIENPSDCDALTMEEWKATILYIAETFDIGRKMQDFEYKSDEDYQAAKKRFNHGMQMFGEYFFNLWD